MRATTQFLFLAAVALCLSACLPPPPGSNDAAIFKRPNRYGWGSNQSGPAPEQPPKKNQRRSGNRFGHSGDDGGGANSPASSENSNRTASSSSSDSDDPSGRAEAEPDDGGDSASGPTEDREMADSGSSSSSSSSGGSSSAAGDSKPPSNLNSYPYARPVPGKKNYVTLPGKDASIGEIDVTGIKPGTPVEIDDPRSPGKKVYFRVP